MYPHDHSSPDFALGEGTRSAGEGTDAQLALRESEERLNLALETGRMGVWEWDIASNKVTWSKTLEKIHGLDPGAFCGGFEDFESDIHPEDRARVLDTVRHAVDRIGSYQIQYRICVPDGRVLWIEARGRAIAGPSGRAERAIGLCMDITERKQAEAAIEELARRKDEVLNVLGHELRNPLAPILNCMHIIRMPNVTPEHAESAWHIMERQVAHLSRLLDDLLDVSRIASGRITLWKERIDLGQLVDNVIEQHAGLMVTRGIAVTRNLPEQPLIIEGDRARLAQVFGNLLSNVAKFTGRDGRVSITVQTEHGTASVSIRDNGNGIDAAALNRVFEPFDQGDTGLDRSQGGLGLGLALVRAVVDLHGGAVEAHSDGIGMGSEFIVRFPLGVDEASGAPAPSSESLNILLIEDNPDAIASMRMMLELEHHHVAIATDGAAGLDIARNVAPDLVLCDIGLPGSWDGYAVSRAFRADPALRTIPMIAVTGYGQTGDRERALASGFDAHLTKPVRYESLRHLFASLPARAKRSS